MNKKNEAVNRETNAIKSSKVLRSWNFRMILSSRLL